MIKIKYLKLITKDDSMNVSKLVLGTDYFGTTVDKKTSFDLLDIYVEAGGNCLDTARAYAQWIPGGEGASEKLIGEWLKERENRKNILISTKGGHPPIGKMEIGRLSRESLEKDLDESLKALNIDYIDIYWLHRDDTNRPVEDIMETLAKMVSRGKVRAIGCSNWKSERINEANNYSKQNNLPWFSTSQIQWSLASSSSKQHNDPTIVCMDDNEYSWYYENDIPVMAFSSQAKGFFAKGALNIENINQKAYERFWSDENLLRLKKVKEFAEENNLTPTAVSLGYLLCNKVKTMAIIGCKNIKQLKDTLTAKDIELSEEVVEWLHNK